MDSKTVLTAAHCVDDSSKDYTKDSVMVGATDKREGQKIQMAQVINHPEYNNNEHIFNDISIIKLSEPIVFSNDVQAMCLPDENFAPVPGDVCFHSGWGQINSG